MNLQNFFTKFPRNPHSYSFAMILFNRNIAWFKASFWQISREIPFHIPRTAWAKLAVKNIQWIQNCGDIQNKLPSPYSCDLSHNKGCRNSDNNTNLHCKKRKHICDVKCDWWKILILANFVTLRFPEVILAPRLIK